MKRYHTAVQVRRPNSEGADIARKPDVLMVSTSYPADASDWRGIFIRHLVYALARRSDLTLRLWAPPGEIPSNVHYIVSEGERRWLLGLMTKGGIAHILRSRSVRALIEPMRLLWNLRKSYRRNDVENIYHVNWLQNALVLPRNDRPLLTTVLGSDIQLLDIPFIRALLRRVFRHRRVAICANADWMLPILEKAFGDTATIRLVPLGIDPAWFRMERKTMVAEPAKWLCVTRLTKGKLGTLFEWSRPYFSDGSRELHLFGPMQEQITIPHWVKYHGPATPELLLEEWFPAAHGLITLSQHAEGRPQVMLEAMAAGLPIIASRLSAHSDLIHEGQTGHICDSAEDVGRALDQLGDTGANHLMGTNGREKVAGEIGTWDDCAGRYAAIYQELLGPRGT